jgi:nucleoside-diphosphate-sugar epimerase
MPRHRAAEGNDGVKVLVTGAAGNLGRATIPALSEAGHEVRLLDFRPLESEHEALVGDIRDADDVRRAVAGVDAVVHAAALHGIHLERWSAHDFWATNVTGTFNVYEAAREEGVRRVVLSSSMAVYGRSMRPPPGAWAVIDERTRVDPGDVYGLTKHLCEELARYHAAAGEIATVSLRFGMYVPETFVRYGFRLLFGGVDERDVAQSVLLALAHEPEGGFDAVDVMSATPFGPNHARELAVDPLAVLDRQWPGTADVVREHGLDLDELLWEHWIWPIEKARRVLGYEPRFGFGEFLDALRRGDESHHVAADLPQWGV